MNDGFLTVMIDKIPRFMSGRQLKEMICMHISNVPSCNILKKYFRIGVCIDIPFKIK